MRVIAKIFSVEFSKLQKKFAGKNNFHTFAVPTENAGFV
jgi:hypothetical protein